MTEFIEAAKIVGLPLAMCLFIAIVGAKSRPVWVFYTFVERIIAGNEAVIAQLMQRLEKSERAAEKWEEMALRGMRIAEKTATKTKGGDT